MTPSKAPSKAPSEAPSEAQERFEFQSKDGSWQPCRNVRDAAMWAADGWTIRSRPAELGEILFDALSRASQVQP